MRIKRIQLTERTQREESSLLGLVAPGRFRKYGWSRMHQEDWMHQYILLGDLTWSGPSTRHECQLWWNLESPTTNFRNFSTIAQRPWEWDPLQELALLRRRPSLRGTPCWRYLVHVNLYEECIYHTLEHDLVKISSFSVLMSGFQMYSPFLNMFLRCQPFKMRWYQNPKEARPINSTLLSDEGGRGRSHHFDRCSKISEQSPWRYAQGLRIKIPIRDP